MFSISALCVCSPFITNSSNSEERNLLSEEPRYDTKHRVSHAPLLPENPQLVLCVETRFYLISHITSLTNVTILIIEVNDFSVALLHDVGVVNVGNARKSVLQQQTASHLGPLFILIF